MAPFRPSLTFVTTLALACWGLSNVGASCAVAQSQNIPAAEREFLWPGLAPGETQREPGTALPPKKKRPTVNRVVNISAPSIQVFPAREPNGSAMLILPGGGYQYVVDNMEGSDAAPIFNPLGITVFVVSYRVSGDRSNKAWRKPVQDAQRAIRWVRHHASRFQVDPEKIVLLGLSAGGQAACITSTSLKPYYEAVDEIDQQSFSPNFTLLAYPWKLEDGNGKLRSTITVSDKTPPTFIVQTHDDRSAVSTGAAKLYLALKESGIDSELHIFRSGGHGYGFVNQPRPNSNIQSWPGLASEWLQQMGLATVK